MNIVTKLNTDIKSVKIQSWLIILFLLVITAGVSFALFYATDINPNMAFPIYLVFSVMALVGILSLSSALLHHLGLSSENEALGLPKGSVRALIALSLIVIFAIMIIYSQMQLSDSPMKNPDGTYMTYDNGSIMYFIPSEEKKDFSMQTLTTVSTLVVAVAGFYFGTRSVETARGEKSKSLSLLTPKNPYEMTADDKELLIILKPSPDGESVIWETPPDGDKKGTLVQIEPNRFKYTPGEDFKETVTMRFKLSRYPEEMVELKVERKKSDNTSTPRLKNTKANSSKNTNKNNKDK